MAMTMRMMYQPWLKGDTFISFDHADRRYRIALDCLANCITESDAGAKIGSLVDNSVRDGDIATDLDPQDTMKIICDKHLKKAHTLVVLIGRDTAGRRFVDWEIAAALDEKCALHGILLPSVPGALVERYLPPRFRDNLESEYASLVHWDDIRHNGNELCSILYGGAGTDNEFHDLLRNNRPLFRRNRPRQKDLTYCEPSPPPEVDAPLPPGAASRIRGLRTSAGLDEAGVAKRLGMGLEDYRKLESDDEEVVWLRLRQLQTLAGLLGVTPLDLLEPNRVVWPDEVVTIEQLRATLTEDYRIREYLRHEWHLEALYSENPAEAFLDLPVKMFRAAAYGLLLDWRSVIPRSTCGPGCSPQV